MFQGFDTYRKALEAYEPIIRRELRDKYNAELVMLYTFPSQQLWCKLGDGDDAALNILNYETIDEFDEADRLVIGYAIAVTNDFHRVRDSMFDRLRAHFDDAQIVELTWRIALCGAFNRFDDMLQTEVDEGVEILNQSWRSA